MSVDPGWYQHYKGDLYYVLFTGTHTETNEALVIYANREGMVFARPLAHWQSPIIDAHGYLAPRFWRILPGSEYYQLPEMSPCLTGCERLKAML